jgi:hypothetical protein
VALPRLVAVLTRAGTVTLRTPTGAAVKALRPGGYVLRVRDRSTRCGLRLRNGGLRRRTGVAFTGGVAWRVTLGTGVLTLRCGAKGVAVAIA